MESTEKRQLEQALGLPLQEVTLDWAAFKQQFALTYAGPEQEETDREHFTWLRFRGDHLPQSCLLHADGRVRGLILRETNLERIQLPALPGLEYLCISGNKNLTELHWAEAYPVLQYVDLSNNQLMALKLPGQLPWLCYLNVSRNKLMELSFPRALPKLEELDASENALIEVHLPDDLGNLQFLFLNKNKLTTLTTRAGLRALRTLNLRDNQLRQLPRAQYDALETLYVRGNPLEEYAENLIGGDTSGNAVEIIAALRAFAQSGEAVNHRAKLIVVGNGRIGKTCMIKKLLGQTCDKNEKYTHGISVLKLNKPDLPGVKTEALDLNVWDFGGQEVFYATHQFFLSEEAAYIYAWTDERIAQQNWAADEHKSPVGDRWRTHDYWLDNIRMHGQDSQVLVVKTHCLETEGVFDWAALKEDYQLTQPPLDFDAFSPEASYLNRLRDKLTEAVNALPLMGQLMPKSFYHLVEALDARRAEKEMNMAAFVALAERVKIPAGDADAALGYLRKTGEVVHFPDNPKLADRIFINPGELTERIYKLITADVELRAKEGEFDKAFALEKLGAKDGEVLLELLIAFELVYPKKTKGQLSYIAPQYLPPLPEQGKLRSLFEGHRRDKSLRFSLRYPRFLPENVMVNLLSQYGPYALDAVYRNAIYFAKEGDSAGCVIEADESAREIRVYTSANQAGDRLAGAVFQNLLRLSKKAEVHVSAILNQWINAHKLTEALEAGKDVELIGGGWLTNKDRALFGFLKESQGQAQEADRSHFPDDDYPKLEQNIIEVDMVAGAREHQDLSGIAEIKILFLSATPTSVGQINTGRESRFEDVIRQFDESRKIKIVQKHGINRRKFQNFVFAEDPHVIHFAGHGEVEGLVLEGEKLKAEVLTKILANTRNLQLVILNACYTLPMAKDVAKHIPYVIGTQGPLPDSTAIAFADSFYVGISTNKPIDASFNHSIIAIENEELPGADIPILVKGKRQ